MQASPPCSLPRPLDFLLPLSSSQVHQAFAPLLRMLCNSAEGVSLVPECLSDMHLFVCHRLNLLLFFN